MAPPQIYPQCRVSARQARLDSSTKVIRGEIYVPFDPVEGATYPIEVVNNLCDSWATFVRRGPLQKLSYDFLRWGRAIDVQHDRETKGGDVVESFLAPEDGPYAPGAWVAAVHPYDSVWPDVEAKRLTGFSVDVFAAYAPITIRVAGKGKVFDLKGVDQWPFVPNEVEVDGEREIQIAELTSITPWGFSLVDRAANRRSFTIDAVARGVQPILRRAPDAARPTWLDAQLRRAGAGHLIRAGAPPAATAARSDAWLDQALRSVGAGDLTRGATPTPTRAPAPPAKPTTWLDKAVGEGRPFVRSEQEPPHQRSAVGQWLRQQPSQPPPPAAPAAAPSSQAFLFGVRLADAAPVAAPASAPASRSQAFLFGMPMAADAPPPAPAPPAPAAAPAQRSQVLLPGVRIAAAAPARKR